MSHMFLCGALAWKPLLDIVLGCSSEDFAVSKAVLKDFEVRICEDCFFPALVISRNGSAAGIFLEDVPSEISDRIYYFANVLGFEATGIEVSSRGRKINTSTFTALSRNCVVVGEYVATAWQEEIGPVALFAAREVMTYFGRESAGNLQSRLQMILARAQARHAARDGVPADVRSCVTWDQVEKKSEKPMHAGFFLTREYLLSHPNFSGGMSDIVKREVFVATDAAIVLPYDAKRDRVMLVEQFRMGPYGRGDPRPWMLEPVAGRIDAGENPENCARRECKEEAGLHLIRLEKISSHYCSPGCSTEYFHCFLGLCDLPALTQGKGGLPRENEDIRTHVLPFEMAMHLVTTGEADNGPLILTLMWLQSERGRLRSAS